MVEFLKNFTKDWGPVEYGFSLMGLGVVLILLLLIGWAASAGGIAGFTATLAIALFLVGAFSAFMVG
ncbi:MAG: hypothetical protein ACKO0Z_25365 [Betaproteobacteria bacterium]